MIIRSIRLKNIKSYGEGPDGGGVTVAFQPGVNRIAGRNGHGKTTLIESLGYALFLSEPRFEEKFGLDRYLLRAGTKAGEIDVTFEHEAATYRVERGLGPTSMRRTKVVDCADQSICAEGDDEVAQFLCETLGLPSREQLAEVFAKLIGVKQGRLTWPFDSKPSEAKRFFEPLFDVAVFRDCFDQLKPAVDIFQTQTREQQRALAVEQQKITDRATSAEQLADAQRKVAEWEKSLAGGIEARELARKEKEQHEGREQTLSKARAAQEKATVTLTAATTRRTDAAAQVKEAEGAAGVLRDSEPAHQSFQKAEAALTDLEQQRERRDALQRLRDAAETERKDREAKAVAAREQALTFTRQREEKEIQLKGLAAQHDPLRAKLETSKGAFEQTQQAAATAVQDRAAVAAWVRGHAGVVAKLGAEAADINGVAKELAAWDPSALVAARNAEQAASNALKAAVDEFTKARSQRSSLQQQLKDIAGGKCPFLKEACRQFDPAKVQSDLDAQAGVILALERKVAEAAPLHVAAKTKLQTLQTSETRLGTKREQKDRAIGKYVAGAAALLPADVVAARDRLAIWEPKLPALPPSPAIVTSPAGAEQVATLQPLLEQFARDATAWWKACDPAITARLQISEQEKTTRLTEQNSVASLATQLTNGQNETAKLLKDAEAKIGDAERLDTEVAERARQVKDLDMQLRPFAGLDAQMLAQRQQRDANRAGHERYLQTKRVADELVPRKQRFLERDAEEKVAVAASKEATTAMTAAQTAFDAGKLAAARADFQQKHDAVTTIETNLMHARAALPVAEQRVAEWRTACAERDRLTLELARLDAAVALTELARRVLQKAAPAVAQHLCDRIAGRAQTLFNQINPDPIRLSWEAERYGLTITPGDRRFAMLSGGEQTKLALALTLAMIEEFGGLRFCIFDEPTYGVDAESRQQLAGAILEAQTAAGLEQLLLVSHDDAFEGKIEHSILLNKSAATGSAVAVAA